jgi:hypothetical protein
VKVKHDVVKQVKMIKSDRWDIILQRFITVLEAGREEEGGRESVDR